MPNPQTILAGVALVGLIILSFMLVWHPVPAANHDYLIFTLGALAGAITTAGGLKLADTIKGPVTNNPTPADPAPTPPAPPT